jgi:hypothetical protein
VNVAEATAASVVAEFVADLSLFELREGEHTDDARLARVADAAAFLAGRAHARLGAGPSGDDVHEQVRLAFGLPS